MKKAMWTIVGLALAGLAIVFYLWFTPGRTPAINEPNSIASLERIRIGGVDQYILIRGNDSSLPVLLFLHGGPGMPAMYLAHAFQRELEQEFVVVQWDRRAAGKSYREDISSTLTTEQLVADTIELTNVLRARFHQDKIYLVGHSWGTYLGMLVVGSTQKFSSSITSFTYTLSVNARRFPSGEGTMEAIQPAPAGISYKTRDLPLASMERSAFLASEEGDANQLFPSAAQLTRAKPCHFQSRTGSILTRRSDRLRIRTSRFSSVGSTIAILVPSGDRSQRGSSD